MASNLDKITKIKNDAINGAPDVTLSTEVKDAYLNAIHDFRNTVQAQIDAVKKLPGYGPSGGFQSAFQAQKNLQNGLDEFETYMGNYVKYLDMLADTVNEAAKRLIKSG